AELERGIDQDDLLAEVGRGGDGHVDRDGRAAHAALRAEERDDDARLAVAAATCAVAAADGNEGDPRELLALAHVDLADRGRQLVTAERLDEELARAGEHRSAEVVRLALDRHHDDGRAWGAG